MARKWISLLQVFFRRLRDTVRKQGPALDSPLDDFKTQSQVPRGTGEPRGVSFDTAPDVVYSRYNKGPKHTYGPRSFKTGGKGIEGIRDKLMIMAGDAFYLRNGWELALSNRKFGAGRERHWRQPAGGCFQRLHVERYVNVWVREHQAKQCLDLIRAAVPGIQLVGTGRWRNLRALAFRYID